MTSRLTDEQKAQVRYWIHTIGCDIVACYSDAKDKFKEYWSNNLLHDVDYDARLEQGLYDDGVAIICGKLRHGLHKGKYISTLDFDNLESFLKFSANDFDYKKLASITRVEWHGNLARIHAFFITDTPFKNATGGGLEVKANKLLTFVSPSKHKDGNQYTAFDTEQIAILDNVGQMRIENRIAAVIPSYLSEDQTSEYVNYLELDNTILHEGERHNAIITIANSYFFRYVGEWADLTDEQRFEKLIEYDRKHCRPSLYDKPSRREEFIRIWNDVIRRSTDKRQEERGKRDQEQEEKEKISIIERADKEITKIHKFATIEEGKRICCYDSGVYIPGGDITIAKEAEKLFRYKMSNHKVTEINGHIMRHTFHKRKEFDANLKIVNVGNGLYNIDTDEKTEHDPGYLSLDQSPIIYDPKAKPKLFGKFLSEVVYPEQIRTVIELMAYTFYRDNPFEVITILHGSGLNGKSVLLSVLTALHGAMNVSNTPLSTIGDRPFALYDLVDKCVNIDEELSNGIIEDTATLKKITGRRLTRVEQKNQTAIEAVIYAKLWFSANEIPQTPEDTDAFHRRINVVTFPNKFQGDKCDIDLTAKLTSPQELSGIFNVLMIALRQVLKNKRIFSSEKTIEDQTRRYDMAVNPVASFIEIAFDEDHDPSDYETKEIVYQAYRVFCKEFKLAVISYENFGKKMKKEGWPEKRITFADDSRPRCWTGIRLTNAYREKLEKARISGLLVQGTLDDLK